MIKNKTPNTLYKFRDWSNEYNRKLLVESELYFSNNYSFNDPFDLQLPIIFSGDIPFNRNSFSLLFLKTHGRPPTEDELRKVKNSRPQIIKNNSKIIEDTKNKTKMEAQKIEDKLGVFCLSKGNKSSLMWGHYANSHKGFCVGLDSLKLMTYIKKIFKKDGDLYDVKYDSTIPEFDLSLIYEDNPYRQYSTNRFRTKFKHWSYEDEMRIIIGDMANKAVKIPRDIFKEIIFGYNMSDFHKKELRIICNSLFQNLKFYQAEPNKDKFEMKIVELK